jgi:hypothetical protein
MHASSSRNTRRFIMFFVIVNILIKKTKGATLIELFTATGKQKVFLQPEMFDLCTTGDTTRIDTIFNSCHTRVNMGA